MLDAPVSGGQVGAENATLSIMVGGKEEVFEKIKPIFEKVGKNIVRIGGNGDGQTCKVANQIVVALTIEAVSEALVFASKAGADVAKVREALLGGFAQSRILEIHGQRMIDRNFQPGFRVRLHQEGPQPGAPGRPGAGRGPSQYGNRAAALYSACCRERGRPGPFGNDRGDREAGGPCHRAVREIGGFPPASDG